MLLRRADVAGILKRNPGVTCFEDHAEHFAPQCCCFNRFCGFDFSPGSHGFVLLITLFERFAVQIVEVRHIIRREQCPILIFEHPLHEQIGNPVRGVHIVGAAAIIAGVLAQLEEFFDIEVPCLEVSADRAFAFAPLVHGNSGVINYFQERHDALTFAVGALDVGAKRTHRRPVVAQTAGKFG